MSEEQAADKVELESMRSPLLSPALNEQSSPPTPPNRQSNNKRQLLDSSPPLSSASSDSSWARSAVSDRPHPAKKHHHEPTSIHSSVANTLETLVRELKTQYEKNSEGHWEKIRYEAADFCLTAIGLAPSESGKEYVAREVGGNDVTPSSCRNFSAEVQAILLGTLVLFYFVECSRRPQDLKRDDYCCLITGKRDHYALGLVAGKTEIDGQGYWSFDPLPLAPWLPTEEQRENLWNFARGIMGDPALEKYSEWAEPMEFQEHYIVLEPSIASEFNRYTLTLDSNPMGSAGPSYEIKINEHSIHQMPLELPASRLLMNASLSNPDQVTLLSFHSFVALLLRESAIGKTWVTDPEWNSIHDINQGTDPSIPDDEKKPEEFLSEEVLHARSEAAGREREEMTREMERDEALREQDPDRVAWEDLEGAECFPNWFQDFKKEAIEEGFWREEWNALNRSGGEENKGNSAR